ncbi:MAG: hypothetical protein JW959_01385 [Pirellulales bacterium]|nr:hypothetical protein [Pirellulales bacterium]
MAYLPTAAIAWRASGPRGAAHAGIAALACLIGAEIALLLDGFFRGSQYVLAGLVAGMFARMSVPLALAAVCLVHAPMQPGGPPTYLLIFYPLILAVEITLSIPSGGKLKWK